MSIHISAKPGEIAPRRSYARRSIAGQTYCRNHLADTTTGQQYPEYFFFTGNYKGIRLTIGASGMGCPSIGIYSYELYNEYDVECIMRIGTCGAYLTSIDLFDLINAEKAYSESTYAKYAFGFEEDHFDQQGKAYDDHQ